MCLQPRRHRRRSRAPAPALALALALAMVPALAGAFTRAEFELFQEPECQPGTQAQTPCLTCRCPPAGGLWLCQLRPCGPGPPAPAPDTHSLLHSSDGSAEEMSEDHLLGQEREHASSAEQVGPLLWGEDEETEDERKSRRFFLSGPSKLDQKILGKGAELGATKLGEFGGEMTGYVAKETMNEKFRKVGGGGEEGWGWGPALEQPRALGHSGQPPGHTPGLKVVTVVRVSGVPAPELAHTLEYIVDGLPADAQHV